MQAGDRGQPPRLSPCDVDRSCWRSGNTDLSALLQNILRRLAPKPLLEVSRDGTVEPFAWETEPGYAVHILNYANPNMAKGWIRRSYAIGAQQVRIELPAQSTRPPRRRGPAAAAPRIFGCDYASQGGRLRDRGAHLAAIFSAACFPVRMQSGMPMPSYAFPARCRPGIEASRSRSSAIRF